MLTDSIFMNEDGSIKSCGRNDFGQLGLNDTNNRSVFTIVPDITGVKQVVCGSYHHTLLLMNDGTIKSCGYNNRGQLGLNDLVDKRIFNTVPNITGVKQISCGESHTVLLMNDGTIKSCGYNAQGQLGLNDLVDRKVFTTVPSITGVKQISCGTNHSFLLMNDGTIKSCGFGYFGQLGFGNNGVNANKIIFTTVPSMTDVKQLSCCGISTFLLMNDGTLKACGYNGYGQLGLNDLVQRNVFTTVPSITGVKQISCGMSHTLLLMNDGTIKGCGQNVYGQLGLNDTTNRSVFTAVPSITGVKQISCGGSHTILLMNAGDVRSCGRNNFGQLGLGNLVDKYTFNILTMINIGINMYLINKKEDNDNLYNIDTNNNLLVIAATSKSLMDFSNGISDISSITQQTEYGKPIDKLNIFSLYSKIVKSIVSLFD